VVVVGVAATGKTCSFPKIKRPISSSGIQVSVTLARITRVDDRRAPGLKNARPPLLRVLRPWRQMALAQTTATPRIKGIKERPRPAFSIAERGGMAYDVRVSTIFGRVVVTD
jgi:hypothetical protein